MPTEARLRVSSSLISRCTASRYPASVGEDVTGNIVDCRPLVFTDDEALAHVEVLTGLILRDTALVAYPTNRLQARR